MAKVQLVTNARFNQVIRAGAFLCIDVATERRVMMAFSGTRNDHYDITPLTENDAIILQSIFGSPDLTIWRARAFVVVIDGVMYAIGICGRMHHIFIGSGRPTPRYRSIKESGPPWTLRGGHVCAYVSNSVGGAGNAPNAAMSADANAFARQIQSGQRGGQARAACYQAFITGNTDLFNPQIDNLPTTPPIIPVPPSVANPIIRQGSTNREAVKLAQTRLNLHGANPQLPITGNFLSMTDTATRAFQRRKGLVVDGIIGPITWGALNANPQPVTPPPQSTWTPRVNDIVQFTGNTHHVSATSTNGSRVRPGRARVTSIAAGRRNPYHLIREPGGGSDVWGWVQATDVRQI